jgi:hypothetical protein
VVVKQREMDGACVIANEKNEVFRNEIKNGLSIFRRRVILLAVRSIDESFLSLALAPRAEGERKGISRWFLGFFSI